MNIKLDISLPSFSRLNNDEYAQFLKSVLKLVETATIEKLAIPSELFYSIKQNVDLLTEASRQSRSSRQSEEIAMLDKQRTEQVSYLLSSFRLGKKSPLEMHKESAKMLLVEFKNYTGVQKLPTRQKSQAIDALLKDLSKPEVVKHLKVLGVSYSVSSLKEINEKYQKLVEVRAENQVSVNVINVKQVRKESLNLYKDLVRYSFAKNTIEPSSESASFIALLNKLMEDTMFANRQRMAIVSSNTKNTTQDKDKEVSINSESE